MAGSYTPGWGSKGLAMRPSWRCSATRTWTSSILTNGGALMPSGRPGGSLTTQASQTPQWARADQTAPSWSTECVALQGHRA